MIQIIISCQLWSAESAQYSTASSRMSLTGGFICVMFDDLKPKLSLFVSLFEYNILNKDVQKEQQWFFQLLSLHVYRF